MVNKILMNQVKKLIKEQLGMNDNKWELRKIQNEIRTLSGRLSRLENKEKDA
jgi:hypothetical protein